MLPRNQEHGDFGQNSSNPSSGVRHDRTISEQYAKIEAICELDDSVATRLGRVSRPSVDDDFQELKFSGFQVVQSKNFQNLIDKIAVQR